MKRLPPAGALVVATGCYIPGAEGWSTPVRREFDEPLRGESRGWSESVERAVAVRLASGCYIHCRADQLEEDRSA